MCGRKYEVRIHGATPTVELLEEFGEVESVEHEVRTVLTGCFADQTALQGFLHLLRGYGLEVVEVRRLAGEPTSA